MALTKSKTVFACQNCGYQSPKWLGKCPDCGSWNSMAEEQVSPGGERPSALESISAQASPPQPIVSIETSDEGRVKTEIGEFDRVLGGGLVVGSVVLIGGDPGIGKSTLLLQALNRLAGKKLKVLYVSGEESLRQTKMRGDRIGVAAADLYILAENSLEKIVEHARKLRPNVLVVDSIQTVFTSQMQSAPGSIGQVRECAGKLMVLSKSTGVSTFLIGHVTKEGAIAGPRVLEHIVDTVLYFEGDRGHPYRILRAVKNRFGSTNEIGVFEMKDGGLEEVANPSELFLAERPINVPGSAVISSVEGTRPILVELQSLVSSTSYGMPRRTAIGVDPNRVSLLVAVLEKKVGMNLAQQDIFVNVAGGVRVDEPAADLGVICAVASSFLDKPIPSKTVVIGEVGLAGEVRGIHQAEIRIREAAKLGFRRCLIPKGNRERISLDFPGIEVIGLQSVEETLEVVF
ncbi:MAG TPA: DNA repair protein RadA [Thermodesulfobacteriota bacterium]|nr:DNA repair protein RadA [Thermodesulfobacteriota bacterium]